MRNVSRYVLLGPDFNCLEAHAHELGQLLRGRDVVVNLIPWNPVLSPDFEFRAPPAGTAGVFQGILRRCYGLPCTVRQEKGQDVAAACGQLVLQQKHRMHSHRPSSFSRSSGDCSRSPVDGGGVSVLIHGSIEAYWA